MAKVKVENKYEIKILENGKIIDSSNVGKNTAILVQNLLSRRSKIRKLKD